ncbi:hypothetical protein AB0937_15770 [Streptomyces sp. NPDC047880]|uniref:hypothetical protein n=1 Tax=Streptomyces sp. NPDC047880 TaxID=3155626 RepID=UPI00345451E7
MHSPAEADACVQELRAALAAHGITLPSLGLDQPALASRPARPLITLGACNLLTAQALTAALRRGTA